MSLDRSPLAAPASRCNSSGGSGSAAQEFRPCLDFAQEPLCRVYGQDAPVLYWIWHHYEPDGEVNTHLAQRGNAYEVEVDEFPACFVGFAWGLESCLVHRGDFGRHQYDNVTRLIDPTVILGLLRRRYGPALDNPVFHL